MIRFSLVGLEWVPVLKMEQGHFRGNSLLDNLFRSNKSLKMKKLITLFFILNALFLQAQFGTPNPANQWDASWVSIPGVG